MKKSILLFSTLAVLSLAACGGNNNSSTQSSAPASQAASSQNVSSAASSQAPSSDPADVSSEPADVSSEPADVSSEPVAEVTYYLVGSFNSWTANEDYAFSHAIVEGYEELDMYALEVTLAVGDELKVTSSKNKWFPDGMGNNYVVREGGECVVYFCPDGGLEDDGFYSGYFKIEVTEPGIDTTVTMGVILTVTNFDAETMQKPQLVWGAEAASNYYNGFVVDETRENVFHGEITFPEEGTYVCKVATWGTEDPWPEYGMFADNEGNLASFEVEEDAALQISGELVLLTEGFGVGTFQVVPADL